MTSLKPCPFCGSKDLYPHEETAPGGVSWIECGDCSTEGPFGCDLTEAVHAWNNRWPEAKGLDSAKENV